VTVTRQFAVQEKTMGRESGEMLRNLQFLARFKWRSAIPVVLVILLTALNLALAKFTGGYHPLALVYLVLSFPLLICLAVFLRLRQSAGDFARFYPNDAWKVIAPESGPGKSWGGLANLGEGVLYSLCAFAAGMTTLLVLGEIRW
jgi:hypothetical protein